MRFHYLKQLKYFEDLREYLLFLASFQDEYAVCFRGLWDSHIYLKLFQKSCGVEKGKNT